MGSKPGEGGSGPQVSTYPSITGEAGDGLAPEFMLQVRRTQEGSAPRPPAPHTGPLMARRPRPLSGFDLRGLWTAAFCFEFTTIFTLENTDLGGQDEALNF